MESFRLVLKQFIPYSSRFIPHSLKAFFILSALVTLGSCAWRMETKEYYLGPMLIRHTEPPDGKAYVNQQVHFPLLLEGGRQWGISLGFQSRITAAPKGSLEDEKINIKDSGETKNVLNQKEKELNKESWELKFFHSHDNSCLQPEFLSRSLWGFGIGVGAEYNAFTLGLSMITELRPQKNKFYLFQFSSGNPLQTIFQTWPYENEYTPSSLTKEVTQ